MKRTLAELAKKLPIYYPIHNHFSRLRYAREFAEWERSGCPVPPPHQVKQNTIRRIARQFGYRALVETGTYYGEMIEAMRSEFDVLYTIELSEYLHRLAVRRFRNSPHIHVIQGDSGDKLRTVLSEIRQPTIFWLDGHYSAGVTARGNMETPILQELGHILSAPDLNHGIVIDDACDFGADPGYPSLEVIRDFILSRQPDRDVRVEHNSIQITPRSR